jgi:hypothetical protein
MPPTNPYIPADLKLLLDSRVLDPDAPFAFGKRLTVRGPRVHENNYYMNQFIAGARGGLPAAGTLTPMCSSERAASGNTRPAT